MDSNRRRGARASIPPRRPSVTTTPEKMIFGTGLTYEKLMRPHSRLLLTHAQKQTVFTLCKEYDISGKTLLPDPVLQTICQAINCWTGDPPADEKLLKKIADFIKNRVHPKEVSSLKDEVSIDGVWKAVWESSDAEDQQAEWSSSDARDENEDQVWNDGHEARVVADRDEKDNDGDQGDLTVETILDMTKATIGNPPPSAFNLESSTALFPKANRRSSSQHAVLDKIKAIEATSGPPSKSTTSAQPKYTSASAHISMPRSLDESLSAAPTPLIWTISPSTSPLSSIFGAAQVQADAEADVEVETQTETGIEIEAQAAADAQLTADAEAEVEANLQVVQQELDHLDRRIQHSREALIQHRARAAELERRIAASTIEHERVLALWE